MLKSSAYKDVEDMAAAIRIDCIRMTNKARSGHVGSMLSMAELVAVLYSRILNIDPQQPKKPNRDRFILSKGHAGAAVYAALCYKGFFPKEWLDTYYQDNGKLTGHISHHVPGVELSTGSLGHGLPIAVGMALAAKVNRESHKIYCLMSDGDINEGSTWEAIMFAAQHKLDNLIAIVDSNSIQALGFCKDIIDLEPLAVKTKAFRWATVDIDGHNISQIISTLQHLPLEQHKPSMVIARTIKAKGIEDFENSVSCHYRYIPDEKIDETIRNVRID